MSTHTRQVSFILSQVMYLSYTISDKNNFYIKIYIHPFLLRKHGLQCPNWFHKIKGHCFVKAFLLTRSSLVLAVLLRVIKTYKLIFYYCEVIRGLMHLIKLFNKLFIWIESKKFNEEKSICAFPFFLFYGVLFYKIGTGSQNDIPKKLLLAHFYTIMQKII